MATTYLSHTLVKGVTNGGTMTSQQVQAVNDAVADTNGKLAQAVQTCINTYAQNAPAAGISNLGALPVPSFLSSSTAGMIRQQIASLGQQVQTTVAIGTSIANQAASGSYKQDKGARLEQSIKDYQYAAQDCINQANQIVLTINSSTVTGVIVSAIKDATSSLATTIATLLNAIGDSIINAAAGAAGNLSIGGLIAVAVIGWLVWEHFK